jgi:hypothetical protein
MPGLNLSPIERLARTADPTLLFADAGERGPHAHQAEALRNWRRDHLLLWSRQAGKSSVGAALAVHNLLFPANGTTPTIVIVSRAERQSGELFRKARSLYGRLPYAPPLVTDSATVMETPEGARVLSYPGSEQSVRGLSAVTLALIDEATLIPAELRDAVSPMLSTTGGATWSMGTARGQSGWFFEEWEDDTNTAVKSIMPWHECAHLSRDYIEKEKARMPSWRFAQEYECQFMEDGEVQLITGAMIRDAIDHNVRALW